jgi:hypothetical protein
MERERLGFMSCGNRGFHLTLENGYTVSVQFGPMNYCDHHHAADFNAPMQTYEWESSTAEVAVINTKGDLIKLPNGDSVDGYRSPDEVATLIRETAALKPGERG